MKKFVIASNNKNKIQEFRALLKDSEIKLVCSSQKIEVEENGTSFFSNAKLKAHAWSLKTGLPALADDSGIVVRALDWKPGIYSARIVKGSDEDRNNWLLDSLSGEKDRYAKYVAAVVLCDAARGWTIAGEAKCAGKIAKSPRGKNGFGYDPIFIPTGYKMTFGELPPEVKQKISHRYLALKHLYHLCHLLF